VDFYSPSTTKHQLCAFIIMTSASEVDEQCTFTTFRSVLNV